MLEPAALSMWTNRKGGCWEKTIRCQGLTHKHYEFRIIILQISAGRLSKILLLLSAP
jgi:hypothetical protein